MTKYPAYNLITRQWHIMVKTADGKWMNVYKSGSRRRAFERFSAI